MSQTAIRYGTITKTFHWTTALLILALIPLGLIANELPYDTNEQLARKAWLFSLHKTLGVAVFFVALLRILWAVTQPKPGPLHAERKLETFAAETVHWLLYGSLVAVPLSGWIHHAATQGFAPIWWPLGQDLPLVPKDQGVADLFGGLHWVLTKVLVASLLLHIAGALKHHLIDKDATLRRMWFGRADVPQVPPHRPVLAAPAVALAVTGAALLGGSAIGVYSHSAAATPATALQAVASDWQVQEGDLSITITQFGNPVTGSFADWTAAITFDPEAETDPGAVEVTVNIASLTLGSVTDQAMGGDFFDVENHPTASFTAPITRTEDGYIANGTLTMKGATLPLALPFTLAISGDQASMAGNITLDRRDFGIGATMNDETNLAFSVAVDVSLTATRAQ